MRGKSLPAPTYNVFIAKCPSREAFEHIFSRWGLLTLGKLSGEPIRFNALRREIDGISEKMLSQTLRILEEEGFVLRKEWSGLPPKVEYRLSEAGLRLSKKVQELIQCFYGELVNRSRPEDTSIAT